MQQPSRGSRPYHAPDIQDLGTVGELTQTGGSAFDPTDSVGYSAPAHTPPPHS